MSRLPTEISQAMRTAGEVILPAAQKIGLGIAQTVAENPGVTISTLAPLADLTTGAADIPTVAAMIPVNLAAAAFGKLAASRIDRSKSDSPKTPLGERFFRWQFEADAALAAMAAVRLALYEMKIGNSQPSQLDAAALGVALATLTDEFIEIYANRYRARHQGKEPYDIDKMRAIAATGVFVAGVAVAAAEISTGSIAEAGLVVVAATTNLLEVATNAPDAAAYHTEALKRQVRRIDDQTTDNIQSTRTALHQHINSQQIKASREITKARKLTQRKEPKASAKFATSLTQEAYWRRVQADTSTLDNNHSGRAHKKAARLQAKLNSLLAQGQYWEDVSKEIDDAPNPGAIKELLISHLDPNSPARDAIQRQIAAAQRHAAKDTEFVCGSKERVINFLSTLSPAPARQTRPERLTRPPTPTRQSDDDLDDEPEGDNDDH